MERLFVTYKISLKLKELGFDEECFGWFWLNQPNGVTYSRCSAKNCVDVPAPLWQQAIDWFRKSHNWLIVVDVANSTEYYASIREFDEYGTIISKIPYKVYSTYDKAREQAILKAIELCKNKE